MYDTAEKTKQTVYERYEMSHFDTEKNKKIESQEKTLQLNQRQYEALREKIRKEIYDHTYQQAYENGLREGKDQGFQQGLEEGKAVTLQFSQLQQQFQMQIYQTAEHIGHDLMELSRQLAKAIIQSELQTQPSVILHIIEEAINTLPAVTMPVKLHLHPESIEAIHQTIGNELEESGWQLKADPHLGLGNCRIETAQNIVSSDWEEKFQQLLRENADTHLHSNTHELDNQNNYLPDDNQD